MAFALRNLSVLAYANGFTLWHYKAEADSQAIIARSGYFKHAGDMLNAGDMVMISAREGGKLVCLLPDPEGIRAAPIG